MKLYVPGPAFQLPSIDAECTAAIALLKQRAQDGEWSLIPTHEQPERLPYLEDGPERLSGFTNIAQYLDTRFPSAVSLNPTQQADCTALTAFLTTHARTLLDITLYVSADNYARTRTAFTAILPWHANYILPPSRREAARLRTEHLGISSIDVDDVHDDLSNKPESLGKEAKEFEPETRQRASLLLGGGRETVRSLLRRPEHSAVFKLHALAENFFGPLRDVLEKDGGKKYLLGTEQPTAVDCLAYGYLSLMQFPDLPQDWLAKVLARKFRPVVEYLERVHLALDVATEAEDVMALGRCTSEEDVQQMRRNMTLPWEPPARSSVLEVGKTITTDLMSRIPLLYSLTVIVPSKPQPTPAWRRYLPIALSMTVTSLGLSLYWAFSTGLLVWPHGEQVHIFGRKRFSDYGHLGAALAGVSLLGQQAGGDRAYHQQQEAERLGNVDVEVERDGR